MALFEEKYGDTVRVVSMGESKELCGGTHASRTGTIGLFLVSSEGSVSSGVRRVECLTGESALKLAWGARDVLETLSAKLKAPQAELADRVTRLGDRVKELEKGPGRLGPEAGFDAGKLVSAAVDLGGVKFLAAKITAATPKDLREAGDLIRERLGGNYVLALAAVSSGKAILLAAVGKDAQGRFKAGDIVAKMAASVGGKGGGKPDLAQAGGPGVEKIDEALTVAKDIVGAGA
jgi:alanyl-tRNA synthetase